VPSPSPDRAAVILCGGLSSRMGRPKAFLPFGPETLLQRVVRICGAVCGERIVVAAAGQDLPALPGDVAVVRDARREQGPLEGIAAGLAAARAPAAFVTSCDVPFLRAAHVARMFDALGDAAVARAVHGGMAQPLLAVYRTSLAAKAARLVGEGRRRVILLAEGERESVVADPDPGSFRDCDTPEEYAEAVEAGRFRVELYGVARQRAGADALDLWLPPGATLGEALAEAAAAAPALVGPVLDGRGGLAAGSAASLDGTRFASDPDTPLPPGRPLLLLPASSGG
jgi:molybdopterin-guanine dinucleotide biosynthesis protein A